jgi:hypothetical protein
LVFVTTNDRIAMAASVLERIIDPSPLRALGDEIPIRRCFGLDERLQVGGPILERGPVGWAYYK